MKVVAGIATTQQRFPFFKQAVNSLRDQVDYFHTWNNSFGIDKADNGKFNGLYKLNEPVYYFSCDDDIIYPPDYVAKMIKWIKAFDGNSIVCSHGRILKGIGLNYYRDHQQFNCARFINGVHQVDVAGTGVTAFRTDKFNPGDIANSPDLRMADLVFSLEAAKARMSIHVVPHRTGYFKMLKVPEHLTCFGMEHKNPARQGELADEIYTLNHGKK